MSLWCCRMKHLAIGLFQARWSSTSTQLTTKECMHPSTEWKSVVQVKLVYAWIWVLNDLLSTVLNVAKSAWAKAFVSVGRYFCSSVPIAKGSWLMSCAMRAIHGRCLQRHVRHCFCILYISSSSRKDLPVPSHFGWTFDDSMLEPVLRRQQSLRSCTHTCIICIQTPSPAGARLPSGP